MNLFNTSARERAVFFAPLGFLKGQATASSEAMLNSLCQAEANQHLQCVGTDVRLWIRYLEWDSKYFGIPTYRLEFVDWPEELIDPSTVIARMLVEFRQELASKHKQYYFFAEIPSEDVVTLQALGTAGMRLIETRITHFRDNLAEFVWPVASESVRVATEADISDLRAVASIARNPYDRFHADPFFSGTVADEFLAEYAEQCVRGLTDVVLVPDDEQVPGAFVCGSVSKERLLDGTPVGRLVLAAVSEKRRGWYKKLHAALLQWMKEKDISICVNTTQSTNRAVIHVCEQLGYKYGKTTHIFSIHQES